MTRRSPKGLRTGLFDGRKRRKLFTSAFGSRTTVYRRSDQCAEWLHSQCPRQAKMYLLDVTIVCDCPCHARRNKDRAAALGVGVGPTRTSRSQNPTTTTTPTTRFDVVDEI
jgi:hypothetical protein